ncbi:MAG: glycoside hydrolase family 16 protein [Fibrobacterales bacterium]
MKHNLFQALVLIPLFIGTGCSPDLASGDIDSTSSQSTQPSSGDALSSETLTLSSETVESSEEIESSEEFSSSEDVESSSSLNEMSSSSEEPSSSEAVSSSEEPSSSVEVDPYAFDPDDFPKYDGFTLKIAEEFNGVPANPIYWKSGDGTWDGNLCRFGPDGIEYNDSAMYLTVQEQFVPGGFSNTENAEVGNRDYICGELATKKMTYKYGRLEGRIKGPPGSGWVTSLFWFHFPKTHWREMDVEVEGQYNTSYKTNIWRTNGEQNNRSESPSNYEIHNFNVYSMEWGPGYVKFYTNDELTREIFAQNDGDTEFVPDEPLSLLANFWISNYGTGFGGPNDGNTYPLKAEYDWIRYYELDSEPLDWDAIEALE